MQCDDNTNTKQIQTQTQNIKQTQKITNIILHSRKQCNIIYSYPPPQKRYISCPF